MQIGGAEFKNFADFPFVHQLFCPERDRKEAVLKRHLRNALVIPERLPDQQGLCPGRRERLVAVDVLVVADCRQERLAVEIVRRADVHNVDVRIFRDFPVVCHRVDCAGLQSALFRSLRSGGADMRDSAAEFPLIVKERNVPVPVGVNLSDESESDDADRVDFHPFFLVFS